MISSMTLTFFSPLSCARAGDALPANATATAAETAFILCIALLEIILRTPLLDSAMTETGPRTEILSLPLILQYVLRMQVNPIVVLTPVALGSVPYFTICNQYVKFLPRQNAVPFLLNFLGK
jgi:hypothetical protein